MAKPKGEERTKVLRDDQETLNKEIQKAKEHDACLIMIRGKNQGERYFLDKTEMTIGRDPAADICVSDPTISWSHAKIHKEGKKGSSQAVTIADLGSSNGTVI